MAARSRKLLTLARETQDNVALKEEVAKMGKLTEKTREKEVMEEIAQREARAEAAAKAAAEAAAKATAEAEARGKELARQRDLQARRDMLRALLEDRFGPLTPEWGQRIEAADNPDRLKAAAVQAMKIGKLDELQL